MDRGTAPACASPSGALSAAGDPKRRLVAKADVVGLTKRGETALHLAAESGHAETAKMLLDAKLDGNLQDENGWTALHQAAQNGHPRVVKVLLDAKVDVTIKDREGRRALRNAYGHPEITSMLMEIPNPLQSVEQWGDIQVEVCSELERFRKANR